MEDSCAAVGGWLAVGRRATLSLRRRFDSARDVSRRQRAGSVALRAERRHTPSVRAGDVRTPLADLDEKQHHVRARGTIGREWTSGRCHPIRDEGSRSLEDRMSDTPEIPQGPLVDDLIDNAATEPPATTPAAPETEQRLSRKAAWLAMGAVTLALLLIWIAPGIEHVEESATTGGATSGSPGEPEDAAAVGKPARLDFQLKDMN